MHSYAIEYSNLIVPFLSLFLTLFFKLAKKYAHQNPCFGGHILPHCSKKTVANLFKLTSNNKQQ